MYFCLMLPVKQERKYTSLNNYGKVNLNCRPLFTLEISTAGDISLCNDIEVEKQMQQKHSIVNH